MSTDDTTTAHDRWVETGGEPPADDLAPIAGDTRYSKTRILAYDEIQIDDHLAERRAQLEQAKRRGDRARALYLAGGSETDQRLWSTEVAVSATEELEQAAIIHALEAVKEDRRLLRLGAIEAHPGRPITELVNIDVAKRGLPCDVDEAGDRELVTRLWEAAYVALETQDDETPTQGDVAERVAEVYSVLYGFDAVAQNPTRDDVAGAKADAEWIENQRGPDYDLDDAGKALAVCVTDPRIRMHLDPKALEQARAALGLTD